MNSFQQKRLSINAVDVAILLRYILGHTFLSLWALESVIEGASGIRSTVPCLHDFLRQSATVEVARRETPSATRSIRPGP